MCERERGREGKFTIMVFVSMATGVKVIKKKVMIYAGIETATLRKEIQRRKVGEYI